MSASLALQEAVVAALSADAPLQALIGAPARIYDDVPRDAIFPYMTIGEGTESDAATMTDDATEHRLILHAWSRYAGRREVKLILGHARRILHDASLTLTGFKLINLRCETLDIQRAGDGRAYHGLARFRGLTEPN